MNMPKNNNRKQYGDVATKGLQVEQMKDEDKYSLLINIHGKHSSTSRKRYSTQQREMTKITERPQC